MVPRQRISRPNRDTRFSADKAPYKTNIYGRIDRPGGGYYVRLYPEGFFVGGGVYSPDRDAMARLRVAGGIEHPLGRWIHTAGAKDRVISGWRAVNPLLDWVVESS